MVLYYSQLPKRSGKLVVSTDGISSYSSICFFLNPDALRGLPREASRVTDIVDIELSEMRSLIWLESSSSC
jgi:hypothetical protein